MTLQCGPVAPFIINMNALLVAGMFSELSYMSNEEKEAALALESELLADAKAGVDLRIRVIGALISE
jgi:hypothetical protein